MVIDKSCSCFGFTSSRVPHNEEFEPATLNALTKEFKGKRGVEYQVHGDVHFIATIDSGSVPGNVICDLLQSCQRLLTLAWAEATHQLDRLRLELKAV